MAKQPKVPIQRTNKFFSMEDFNFEVEVGREYLEGDLNMSVILYRVDRTQDFGDDLYGEAKKDEIRFLPPVEVHGMVTINPPDNKSYNPDGSLRYNQHGQMTFGVYNSHLDELDIDISYGDYIAYALKEDQTIYYSVVNDGKIDGHNAQTIAGIKGAYRIIICAIVDETEFRGI